MSAPTLTVLAMGGNSLLDPAAPPTVENQFAVTRRAIAPVAELMARGERLVITHGNGPQVGWMLLRSELSRAEVHEVPLDSLVADSQGAIGYMLQRLLREELAARGLELPVATVVTEIEVDPDDPAFQRPEKPVGLFYDEATARQRATERGWRVREDAGRGWRRVVPSPRPRRIVELDVVRLLVADGATVITCGGGGVPIMRDATGHLRGVEAVIDKDHASALLATSLGAERLVITTGVRQVMRGFRTPDAAPIVRATPSELAPLLAAGEFPAGSMGPKIQAAFDFITRGGREVIICHPDDLVAAISGAAGTHITRETSDGERRAGARAPHDPREERSVNEPLSSLPSLDPETLSGLAGRSMLSTRDFDDAEIDQLLAVARAFELLDRAGVKTDLLPNELAWALFFDNSTRTKSAWAGAAARLGMHPVIVDGSSTQIAHGETESETGAMLGMNAHALGVRHDLILGEGRRLMRDMKQGVDDYLRDSGQTRSVPLVNLQCDLDHPTQTLADLQWLRERLGVASPTLSGSLAGRRIAVSWAYSPSYAKPLSVPQGLVMLLTRAGADVVLAHPEGYELLPEALQAAHENATRSGGRFSVTRSMDEAFAGADAVYPKSWGPMELMRARVEVAHDKQALTEIEKKALARNAAHTDWICDERRMALTRDALYLHCLPADIGAEVSADVMARFRHHVAAEAQKKLYAIMALIAVAKVDHLAHRLAELAARAGDRS